MENLEGLTNGPILVTGGVGFVGSHLVEALVDTGASVVVLYREIHKDSYFARKELSKSVQMVQGDLRDYSCVSNVITRHAIRNVFHIGAQAIVETAYKDPLETMASNVMGTTHVLEACRKSRAVETIIVASSDKAYGKSKETYTEQSSLHGDHPYDVSKSATDLIAQTYFKTYSLPVVITRFGNIYGPGDVHRDRIVPGAMEAYVSNSVLRLRSDGTPVRDYVYVKDVASAYIFLLMNRARTVGQAYNISSADSCSVIELIRKMDTVLGKTLHYTIDNTAINEIPFQHLDDAKIRSLGWKNSVSFDDAIKETYTWYKTLQM